MEELDFPTTEFYTKEDVKRVQERILQMAKIAVEVLDRHHIQYLMAYGTLLGAVRHNGFIPWDDDFDLFLFDDEYENALEYLRSELPEDMIVHDRATDFIYWPSWSKIRDIHTEAHASQFPDGNVYRYRGVGIDLYRLKKMPRSQIQVYCKQKNIEFLVRKHDAGMMNQKKYEELFKQWTKEYINLLDKVPSEVVGDKEVYCFYVPYPQEFLPEDIFPLKKYPFGNTAFWGPNHADAVLKNRYGDYRKIPDFRDRTTHIDQIKFDR